jgi:hypothetical protein
MTGYEVPSQAPKRPARPRAALPTLELVAAGLGLLAFLLAFLPWMGLDCSGLPAGSRSACAKVHYQGWALPAGTAGTVLLLVAAVLLVRRLVDATADRPSAVPALLAALGALLILVQLLVGFSALSVSDIGGARKIGLFLALLVGLAEAALAVLSWLRITGRLARHKPEESGGWPWDRTPEAGTAGWRPSGQPQQAPAESAYRQQAGYPAQAGGYPPGGYPAQSGAGAAGAGQDYAGQNYANQNYPANPGYPAVYPPAQNYRGTSDYPAGQDYPPGQEYPASQQYVTREYPRDYPAGSRDYPGESPDYPPSGRGYPQG